MKRVAIIGPNGYLGSYLLRRLAADGYEVAGVYRNQDATADVIINCSSIRDTSLDNISLDDSQNILESYMLYRHSGRYINIASGAEFDRRFDIDNAPEPAIAIRRPIDAYGHAKNLVSRLVLETPDNYSLRLFGCFDSSEIESRLFKRLLRSKELTIPSRMFDYFSAHDFYTVVRHYIQNDDLPKDMNCVYPDKYTLHDVAARFVEQKGLGVRLIKGPNENNYTGSGWLLQSLGLTLCGLDDGIRRY